MNKEAAEAWLNLWWREFRDGHKGQDVDRIHGALMFMGDVGLLSAVEIIGWRERFRTCPGHDDEGGRNWCAYCGTMKSENRTEETQR